MITSPDSNHSQHCTATAMGLASSLDAHFPLCGRNKENFSEDPVFSASCSYFKMKGFQSFPELGVTLKHFFFNSQEDNYFFVNENIHERSFREI
ncbi:hypothetical protein M9Y10_023166 [Tritrichomonas musculus]|uniref:Uncharacterized protein n=1 Tax=Tritrichomonas musculus TaxID=1915356 RepID=A0ABR2KUD5_9EUKA